MLEYVRKVDGLLIRMQMAFIQIERCQQGKTVLHVERNFLKIFKSKFYHFSMHCANLNYPEPKSAKEVSKSLFESRHVKNY